MPDLTESTDLVETTPDWLGTVASWFAPLRRRAALYGVLAAVLALIVGYTIGALSSSLSTPGTDSAEAGFARDMSLHHSQAVTMAMIAYPKLTDPDLRQVAYDIATSQQYQRGVMQSWLTQWNLGLNGTGPHMAWMPPGQRELQSNGLMPGVATDAQLNQLTAATGKQLDILFCQLMLRHHLGGIHMIDGILQLSHDSEVTNLAQTMKANQEAEIDVFATKLKAMGALPLQA
jgi:uncharacterized protein (DUF305 family)